MKKQVFLFFYFLITFCVKAQTWIYHPFPEASAVWNIHYKMLCIGSGDSEEYYSIMISGDTIINSKTYHKLITPYIESVVTGNCVVHTAGYKGAIRQDTIMRKVFYVPPVNNIESLLYDFNMKVGDTVKGYTETAAIPIDTVQSIDSVLVGGSFRKRWNINSGYNIHLIEGVGSTYGLIAKSPGIIFDNADFSIICFKHNGQSLYPSTTNCELITSINSNEENNEGINIFPNPSNGSFNIAFSEKFRAKEIQITDLFGNIIVKQLVINQANLKLESLKSGIYILILIDDNNNRINRKIIRY